jgi:hypothetical protein
MSKDDHISMETVKTATQPEVPGCRMRGHFLFLILFNGATRPDQLCRLFIR